MNILFISRNSPFESVGGIERYITNLITYYKSQKEAKLFLLLPTEKSRDYSEKKGNVRIFYSRCLFLSRSDLVTNNEIKDKSQLFSEKVKDILQTRQIDIVCAENFHTDLPAAYSLLLAMVATTQKIPLVLQLHSFATTELQTELVNQLPWDKISCVSKSVAGDSFRKGADINYLSTHYLGVNTKEFTLTKNATSVLKKELHLEQDNRIILTATRIIRGKRNILQEKGLINLIQSFSKLAPRYPHVRLLIAIGTPPENLKKEFDVAHKMLLGYIKLHNIEEQTIVKPYALLEMPYVYQGSDIFVLPSENETFGQVFIEAMSCGVPVIGTKVGGIPEIISDSHNGFLILADDASILAQKIEILLNDESLRKRFIYAGIKTVQEKFTSVMQLSIFTNMLKQTMMLAKK